MPDATPLLGTYNSLWLRKDAAMEKWRLSAVRLEQPHMKNVMDPGVV
jgi:hypothetical protein